MTVHVYTSIAANYLPKVRVLFESLRRWRPEWRLHVILADETPPAAATESAGADEIHGLEGLGIPKLKAWAFTHTLIELATAIKPFGLKALLARDDCAAAIYLDPDIVVFSALETVTEALARADIVLTPHVTRPETTHAGILANEICTAQHGIYNLGFIGVAARDEGLAFAEWWADRVYRFCREDIGNGLYTDQRWVEFAPAYFDRVAVLRDPTLNVAPWNLSMRRMEGRAPDALTVDGRPLGFFHFSQVDKIADLSGGQPAAAALVDWYRAQTAATQAEGAAAPWSLASFEDGAPILLEQRLVYRLRGDLQDAFADPYRSGAGSFQAWWASAAPSEFPALFDSKRREAELARLASAMTTGNLAPS